MNAYWYCGIEVKGIDYVYSYISDLGQLDIGTPVVVPFGRTNQERVGIVKSCAVYLEKDAPYPVERTKHILRLATEEEFAEVWLDFDDIEDYIDWEAWDEVYEWAKSNQDSPYRKVQEKVVSCLTLCTENCEKEAALLLGTFYYNGKLVEQNYKKAFACYKIAADADLVRAICNCGYCFYYGRHQEPDYQQAYYYFSLGAVLHEDANCIYKLGDLFRYGYGVEKSEKRAFRLYQRALERCRQQEEEPCIGEVQFRMGECLLYGIGVERNIEEAHVLLSFAQLNFYQKRKNDPHAAGMIEMTKLLIAEAQELLDAETWGVSQKKEE